MSGDPRHHDLDNLRALAMLAGVLFHAALAYSPLVHPLFPTADQHPAWVVDLLIWFMHLFRMPLFFVVAGFFTALQVQRHGLGGMFRSRLLRIGLPFVLFVPLVHVSMSWATLRAAAQVANPSPLLAMIRELQQAGPLPPHPPGTSHLWFLYYLLLFLVLLWVARSLELSRHAARLRALAPVWTLIALPLLLALTLRLTTAPHPAPESFLPQFWAIGYYGAFFTLGYLMQGEAQWLARFRGYRLPLLLGSLLLHGVFMLLLEQRPAEAAFAGASWSIALVQGAISVWMTLVCLLYGKALLRHRHRLLAYLAEASYWTYIVHLPILFLIQYRLLDVQLPWPIKFAISVLLTLGICLLSYALLVRHTWLGRLLGGRARSTAKCLSMVER